MLMVERESSAVSADVPPMPEVEEFEEGSRSQKQQAAVVATTPAAVERSRELRRDWPPEM